MRQYINYPCAKHDGFNFLDPKWALYPIIYDFGII